MRKEKKKGHLGHVSSRAHLGGQGLKQLIQTRCNRRPLRRTLTLTGIPHPLLTLAISRIMRPRGLTPRARAGPGPGPQAPPAPSTGHRCTARTAGVRERQ